MLPAFISQLQQPRMALADSYLSDLSDEQRQAAVKRLLSDKNSPAQMGGTMPACLQSVLQVLSAEPDFDKFATLKMMVDDEKRTELILSREGRHHEKAGEKTPMLIKSLRPATAGCYLNWQPALSQFAGYYAKPGDAKAKDGSKKKAVPSKKGQQKKMHSTARMYGGKWTQVQALSLVVTQLWKWHEKYGGVPRFVSSGSHAWSFWIQGLMFVRMHGSAQDVSKKPSPSDIKDAMDRVLAGEVDPGPAEDGGETLPAAAEDDAGDDAADVEVGSQSVSSISSSSSDSSSNSVSCSSSQDKKKKKKDSSKKSKKKSKKSKAKASKTKKGKGDSTAGTDKAEPTTAKAAKAKPKPAVKPPKAKPATKGPVFATKACTLCHEYLVCL